MIKLHNFNKGQNKDTSELYQPVDTAKEIKNFIQINEDGDLYSLVNEKGTVTLNSLPEGFKVIGHTVLDQYVILVLAHSDGRSQVGVVYNDIYERRVPSTDAGTQLGFSVDHPVDCVARKIFSGDKILYFTDNNQPIGLVNIDNPPLDSELSDNIKLIPDIDLPVIEYVEQLETGGSLNPGVYQFAVRYVNDDNTTTTLTIPTNPIPVVDEFRSVGKEFYDGAATTQGPVNKTIRLRITDLDQDFDTFEIIAISYEGETNTFSAYVLPEIAIEGTSRVYDFSSTSEGVPITLEELRALDITYDKAKCIEQKDNRLLFANLTESTTAFDEELQQIANRVQVTYGIDEEEYNEPSAISSEFEPIDSYELTNDEIDTYFSDLPQTTRDTYYDRSIITTFSSIVSTASSQENNYSVLKGGSTTIATIQVTDYTVLNGDTLTLEGSDSTDHNYVFNTDISVGASNDETAENISDFLQTQSVITDLYSISFSGDTVTLVALELSSTTYNVAYSDTGAAGTGIALTNVAGTDPVTVDATIQRFTSDQLQVIIVLDSEDLDLSTNQYAVDFNNFLSGDGTTTTSQNIFVTSETTVTSSDTTLYKSALDNYKLEERTVSAKTYRRNEVYSFSVAVEFKNGGRSFAFHIPGNDKTVTTLGKNPANTVSGELGTYVSSFEYPLNQDYPGNSTGDDPVSATRNIRHHVMPTVQQEPHYREDSSGVYIRRLKLNFEFTRGFSQELRDSVSRVYIMRESRSNSDNRSILAQGISKNMREHYTSYDSNGALISSSLKYKKVPGFGASFNVGNTDTRAPRNNPSVFSKWAYDTHDAADNGFPLNVENLQVFYTPELHFNAIDKDLLSGAFMNPVMQLDVNRYTNLSEIGLNAGFQPSQYKLTWDVWNSRATLTQDTYPKVWMYGNYVNPQSFTGSSELIEDVSEVKTLNDQSFTQSAETLSGDHSTGYFVLKTQNNVTYPEGWMQFNSIYSDKAVREIGILKSSFLETGPNDDSFTFSGTNTNKLINIERQNYLTQYGDISSTEYVYVDQINTGNIIDGFQKNNVYGGDTFINKFAVIEKDVYEYLPRYAQVSNINATIRYEQTGTAAEGADPDISTDGLDIRAIHHFFVESSVNVGYRHEFIDDEDNIQTKYFPKSNADDSLGTAYEKGLAVSYNTQYSFENKTLTFFARGLNDTSSKDFSTRIIYSSVAQEDSLVDNYRNFPQNNYQDIPRNTGEIWDLFVESNTVYAHTPKSLWRLYSDPTSISATTIGEVVLGTGETYRIPAQGRSEMSGGYAGSISQFAGTHTPAGYIFPDVLQGKVFTLLGGQLSEISKKGMIKFFDENLPQDLRDYSDNPYTGIGVSGVYDFSNKRYIISKKDNDDGFTQSFSFLSDSWFSEHDYRPDAMISFNNRLFFIKDNDFTEMNTGDYGSYFGTVYPSSIKLINNENPLNNKTYDNLYVKSNKYGNTGIIPFSTFDTIKVLNDYNESDTYDIQVRQELNPTLGTTDLLCRFKNEEYKLSIPRDNSKSSFKKRMKGKFLEIDLSVDNTDNEKFVLDYIKSVYRLNIR